jgi:F-type H+-transporting ATPase subunit gamma
VATLRDIRRRIGSAQNTKKVTNALQLVASAKLRRAQQKAIAARPYAELSAQVLAEVASRAREYQHPYLVQREGNRSLVIVITTDRGLCGAVNSNVVREYLRFEKSQAAPCTTVAIGRKGRDALRRMKRNLIAEVTNYGESPQFIDIVPAVTAALDEFRAGKVDQVFVLYSKYVSISSQVPTLQPLVPVAVPEKKEGLTSDYIYEPDPEEVLDQLLPRYVEAQVYRALVENLASEQAAKMIAMSNATDAAADLIDALTLLRNKLRQETITKELMEIVGGVAALEKTA